MTRGKCGREFGMHPRRLSREFRRAFVDNVNERYLRGGLGVEFATPYNVGRALGLAMEPLTPSGEDFWRRLRELADQGSSVHREVYDQCEAARILEASGTGFPVTMENIGRVIGVEPDGYGLYSSAEIWRRLVEVACPVDEVVSD